MTAVIAMGNDLARNYGFDITMPDGNVGVPSAIHKEYMEQCQAIYREFVNNMSIHMKTEKALKKVLKALHEEKIRNHRFSLYRSESADPFARKATPASSSHCFESPTNTPWGLNIIPDEDESPDVRPQTAPARSRKSNTPNVIRPKTAAVPTTLIENASDNEDDDDDDDSLSQFSVGTRSTVAGVVDRKLEGSSSRLITVGPHSFLKIAHGNVRAKLKHRDGRFIVKPIRVSEMNLSVATAQNTKAYDPSTARLTYDPSSERLALVRKLTKFSDPTIASDMKINNRVPIQKSLQGIKAKRMTVSEVFQNARDRATRHFRIVPYTPGQQNLSKNHHGVALDPEKAHTLDSEPTTNGRNSAAKLSLNIIRDSPRGSISENNQGRSKAGTKGNSASRASTSSSRNLGESMNSSVGLDANGHQKRPGSKVAFARADSQLSQADSVFSSGDYVDLGASHKGTTGGSQGSHGTGKTTLQPPSIVIRNRSGSGNTVGDFRSETGSNAHNRAVRGDSAPQRGGNLLTVENVSRVGGHMLRKTLENRTAFDLQSEMATSVSSAGHSVRAMAQKQKEKDTPGNKSSRAQENNARQDPASAASNVKLKAAANAARFGSRMDTVKVVRQQMKADAALDERMTVWRRRMAVKSSVFATKIRPSGLHRRK